MTDPKRPEKMTDGELAAELKEFWSTWIGFDADGNQAPSPDRINRVATEAMKRFRSAALDNRILPPGENIAEVREKARLWDLHGDDETCELDEKAARLDRLEKAGRVLPEPWYWSVEHQEAFRRGTIGDICPAPSDEPTIEQRVAELERFKRAMEALEIEENIGGLQFGWKSNNDALDRMAGVCEECGGGFAVDLASAIRGET